MTRPSPNTDRTGRLVRSTPGAANPPPTVIRSTRSDAPVGGCATPQPVDDAVGEAEADGSAEPDGTEEVGPDVAGGAVDADGVGVADGTPLAVAVGPADAVAPPPAPGEATQAIAMVPASAK